MDEQSQTNLMHHIGLREGQSLADKPRQPLSQGIIPTLDVSRLPGVFATSEVLFIGNDLLIGVPEIRVAIPCPVDLRDCCPQLAAGLLAAVANHKSDHLSGRAAQGDPHPTFVDALENE